jgi:hypothetical protein
LGFSPWAALTREPEGAPVEDGKVLVHVFLAVLIMGTLWRLTSYHLLSSDNPHLQHLGQGMSTQY